MKKAGFLSKLIKQRKLGLVESSDEMKRSYIQKSESNMVSAKILLENDKLEEAVTLVYYSMYHMLNALLFKTGIKSESHYASIFLMKAVFGLDNSEISYSKKERVDKQYYVDFVITMEEVEESVKKAEIFNSNLNDFISKMTSGDVEKYRERFSELLKQFSS
jgi:uncharacterized protein (UPF0332 family)